ncbi:hypothetical protein V8E53_011311 [Lactarius tabidus]
MQHNLSRYRDQLLTVDCHGASKTFTSSVSWLPQRTGNILVDLKTNQNAVISVVGCVLDNRLDCSSLGNHGKRPPAKFPTAKFHLLLGKPTKTIFADDFDIMMKNLENIQDNIGSTKNHQNLVVCERGDHALRFTRSVFETRQPPIPGVVDKATEQWPVPLELRDTMDKIRHTHRAVPLRVFLNEKLIDVDHVMDVLVGALIEMHFELRHYAIQGSTPPLDSFNANIEQIMVLQPGEARPPTAYKQSTEDDGPIRRNPLLAALQHDSVTVQEAACLSSPYQLFSVLTFSSASSATKLPQLTLETNLHDDGASRTTALKLVPEHTQSQTPHTPL